MHTRRIGAFIIGAWLIGTVLVWFATGQAIAAVQRTITDPPLVLGKFIEQNGDLAHLLLRYHSREFARHITESWEVVQLGLGGALLASALMTMHRSRILVGLTIVLMLVTASEFWLITKPLNVLSRDLDFARTGNTAGAVDRVQNLQVWHRVLEILKLGLVVMAAARLLVDAREIRLRTGPTKPVRRRRNRREESQASLGESAGRIETPTAESD